MVILCIKIFLTSLETQITKLKNYYRSVVKRSTSGQIREILIRAYYQFIIARPWKTRAPSGHPCTHAHASPGTHASRYTHAHASPRVSRLTRSGTAPFTIPLQTARCQRTRQGMLSSTVPTMQLFSYFQLENLKIRNIETLKKN